MTNINNWTWPKLKPTNLNLTSGVLRARCFFLVEEWSDGASEAGPTAPAHFWGVKLMFVIFIFFGHVQLPRFIVVKTLISFIFVWSCEFALYNSLNLLIFDKNKMEARQFVAQLVDHLLLEWEIQGSIPNYSTFIFQVIFPPREN